MANEYRIRNHPLEEVSDYTMTLYIDMLCTVASYENANPEAAYKLIANIMLSAGMKHPISEHIKNAMQLTPERFSEFVTECRNNELQYIFLIDSLLIICSNGQPCKKQIEFIAGVASVFNIIPENFKGLAKLAAHILEQNKDYFNDGWHGGWWLLINDLELEYLCELSATNYYSEFMESNIKTSLSSLCYVKQFSDLNLYLDDYPKFTIESKSGNSIHLSTSSCNYSPTILYKSHVNQAQGYYRNNFRYSKIVIENECIDKDEYALGFGSPENKEIIMRNCEIVKIRNIFGDHNYCNFKLENCIFNAKLSYYSGYSALIDHNIVAENCIFDCHNKNIFSTKYSSCYLFSFQHNATCINCQFINLYFPIDNDNAFGNIILNDCEFIECEILEVPNFIKITNAVFRNCKIYLDWLMDSNKSHENQLEILNNNGCQFINCKFLRINSIKDYNLKETIKQINQTNCQFLDHE